MQTKMYAIACDHAEALKNCFTGKYTNQPFWPEHRTLLPLLEKAKRENPELVHMLKIYCVKVSGGR